MHVQERPVARDGEDRITRVDPERVRLPRGRGVEDEDPAARPLGLRGLAQGHAEAPGGERHGVGPGAAPRPRRQREHLPGLPCEGATLGDVVRNRGAPQRGGGDESGHRGVSGPR